MKDIDDMFNSEHHFLLGVNVPAPSASNPDTWIKLYWEPDKIQAEKVTILVFVLFSFLSVWLLLLRLSQGSSIQLLNMYTFLCALVVIRIV